MSGALDPLPWNRGAVLFGEGEAVVCPVTAPGEPVGSLLGAPGSQRLYDDGRKGHCAGAGLALRPVTAAGLTDERDALVEIDFGPRQPDCLVAAEAAVGDEGVQREQPLGRDGVEKSPGVFGQ